jgi:hypothetical protein
MASESYAGIKQEDIGSIISSELLLTEQTPLSA